ncbi:SNW/SKI-interacting protein-like [Salvia hispanica]|uniref:SNW/SKI-interacting protein-like n=1 Tax=Salvia hispanica TaxID=49212 RepID=UPI002009119D|nr:SNW/SKI-interacting protein-like [Salvia hispanica]
MHISDETIIFLSAVKVMHSPPRPVTVKDQQEWNIPPCISNLKNPKDYTIPLDKWLAADGCGLREVQINDNFVKPSEALYVAEQKARDVVVAVQSMVQNEMMMAEKEKKHMELRMLAQKARSESTGVVALAGGISIPSETLYVAEQKAREAVVAVQSKAQKEMMMTRKEKKHMELLMLAHKARSERTGLVALPSGISIPSKNAANYGDTSVEYERGRGERIGDGPKETKEEKELRLQREAIPAERRRERKGERGLKAEDAGIGKNKETKEEKEERSRREKIRGERRRERERERILEANYARIGKNCKLSAIERP